jgi:hypothetical protein
LKLHRLINRNADLKQLQDEGYDIEVFADKFLLVHNIPYVNSECQVLRGTLVTELTFAGDDTVVPHTHVAYFIGKHPCTADGAEMARLKHSSPHAELSTGFMVNHMFSMKPEGGYRDFHHKVQIYAAAIEGPAVQLDESATSRIYPTYEYAETDSVFMYPDTATSKAGIDKLNHKFVGQKIGIVGVGGTGSYILDLVAKTPVEQIHLFDGDLFLNHNAFRSPGAANIDDLRGRSCKASYFAIRYKGMHRNVIPHDYYIDASTVIELKEMDFVFICIDRGQDKPLIMNLLAQWGIPLIDVGIGVEMVDDALLGTVRTVLVGGEAASPARDLIPVKADDAENAYVRNVQIADINALNGVMAVMAWKRYCGFYKDYSGDYASFYSISGNTVIKEG